MIVINRKNQFLEDVKSLEEYILSEVNIRKLTISQDKSKYGVHLKAEPNFKQLGARLKSEQKKVVEYLKVIYLNITKQHDKHWQAQCVCDLIAINK